MQKQTEAERNTKMARLELEVSETEGKFLEAIAMAEKQTVQEYLHTMVVANIAVDLQKHGEALEQGENDCGES